MGLQGRTAVVTGGAGNIGAATARRLLAEGARVLIVVRDAQGLEAQRAAASGELHTFTADVTSAEEVRACADRARELFGAVDIFFDNAGVEGPSRPITEYPDDAFDRVIAVNVRGVFLGIKYLAPVMRDGGSIVITSSIAGLMGSGGFVAYTASKHAVIGIMRDAAIDLAPRRIRVNTVHPGFVRGDMMRRILVDRQPGANPDELLEGFVQHTRLGRFIEPDEIAGLVAFLAGDETVMVTGQTFVMDAGTML
jgi:NAD(P)-dependent dehydrogenase (short-subunit alcohol dehydrogenase family)